MDYCDEFIELWNETSCQFSINLHEYTKSDQKIHEEQFNRFLLKIQEVGISKETNSLDLDQDKPLVLLAQIFKDALGYSDEQLTVMLSGEMVHSTYHFVNAAIAFDPEMSFKNIFQACRNVWIMNGVQFLLGQKIELTPAIFAYSMLYPYTDNYLDDSEIDTDEKVEFCDRFAKRLNGEEVFALNGEEEKIFRMVEIIEEYWDRKNHPKVYLSLLAIHEAQVKSIVLLNDEKLSADDILKICVRKGGASVVADGFLIMGDLSSKHEEFLYFYGAYLQLLDDLQDVSDDVENSLMTLFSVSTGTQKLDEYICSVHGVGQIVISKADRLGTGQVCVFKSLMKKSIDLFLIESVVSNSQFYSKDFVSEFEIYSPMSFPFIRSKTKSFYGYHNHLFDRVLKHAMLEKERFPLDFLYENSLQKEDSQAV